MYFLFFHWYFVEHSNLNEQIETQQQSRKKYTHLSNKIPLLKDKIKQVNAEVGENDKFLNSDTANLANAEITAILKNIVNSLAEDASDCQILSQTPTKDRNPEQFEKIILRVRMRCQYDLAIQMLMAIEDHTPYLFLEDVRLEQRAARRSRRVTTPQQQAVPDKMEIRFNMYAYLDNPIAKKNEK